MTDNNLTESPANVKNFNEEGLGGASEKRFSGIANRRHGARLRRFHVRFGDRRNPAEIAEKEHL